MFHIHDDIVQMTYELYVDEKLAQKQIQAMPVFMHKQVFMDTVRNLCNDSAPVRLKITQPQEVVWDQFEQKHKTIINYLEYKNTAYLAKYGRE